MIPNNEECNKMQIKAITDQQCSTELIDSIHNLICNLKQSGKLAIYSDMSYITRDCKFQSG